MSVSPHFGSVPALGWAGRVDDARTPEKRHVVTRPDFVPSRGRRWRQRLRARNREALAQGNTSLTYERKKIMSAAPDLASELPRFDKGDDLPCKKWGRLQEGCHVMVQCAGETILKGEVDVVSPDASIFWVWLDGGRGRIAVYADENTNVWLPKGT
jgi:hypothetical protein